MIAANVAAAQTLTKAMRPCVFRVHDQPDPEKMDALRDQLPMRSARNWRAARFCARGNSTRCWPM